MDVFLIDFGLLLLKRETSTRRFLFLTRDGIDVTEIEVDFPLHLVDVGVLARVPEEVWDLNL